MYVRMLLHVGFLVKPFTAKLARIRSGVGMDQQVRGQRRRPLERFTALFALEQFLHVVRRSPTTQPPAKYRGREYSKIEVRPYSSIIIICFR